MLYNIFVKYYFIVLYQLKIYLVYFQAAFRILVWEETISQTATLQVLRRRENMTHYHHSTGLKKSNVSQVFGIKEIKINVFCLLGVRSLKISSAATVTAIVSTANNGDLKFKALPLPIKQPNLN